MDNKWFGMLTIHNIDDVANKMLDLLSGKLYTFVSVYEYKRYEPETRVNQKLKNGNNGTPLSVWHEKNEYAGFNFCDSYGCWGCSTDQQTNEYDSTFKNPYVVIDYDSITISQKTPEGRMSYWQITIQTNTPDETYNSIRDYVDDN